MQILQEQKQKNETQHNKVPENRKRISANPLNGRGTGRKTAAGQKGFTLPELLLVVGILVILAAVSIPAIVKYRDNLRQTELDEKARAVFIAAQNRLSEIKATGTKLDFEDGTHYYGEAIPGTKTPNDSSFNEISKAPDACLEVTDETGSNFMDGTIYASSALSSGTNYIIEYDSVDYMVYGVWYWEENASFLQKKSEYSFEAYKADINSFTSTSGSKTVNDLRTNKESREIPLVGYYGGAIAATKKEEVKTLDFNLSVDNGPELKLMISAPDSATDKDSFMHEAVFFVKIASDYGTVKEYSFKPAFTKTGSDYTANALKTNPGDTALTSEYKGGSWSIVLDSLEANKHFANLFPGITAGSNLKITVTASSSSTTTVYEPVTKMVTTNSLFGSLLSDGKKVEISNGRHLQNLSPNASHFGFYTDATSKVETKDALLNITEARLTKEVDWKESYTPLGADAAVSYDEISTLYSNETKVNFYPIGNTCGTSADTGFRIFNGNNNAIRNLHITTNETEKWDGKIYGYAGLFGYLAGKSSSDQAGIKNLTLINPSIASPAPLTGVSQDGDSYAGSFAGYLENADIKNCYTYLVDPNSGDSAADQAKYLSNLYESKSDLSSGVIAGSSTYAGGLVGKAKNLKADNCLASVKVTGSAYAGGLIGYVVLSDGSDSNTYFITNCCAGGHIEKENAYSTTSYNVTASTASGSAGGFIGASEGSVKISQSFTTCSASSTGGVGPFSGKTNESLNAEKLTVYGAGAIGTDGTTKNTDYSTDYERASTDAQLTAANTHSYDATLLGDGSTGTSGQKAYPYKSWQSFFYGDWTTAASTVTPGFVYYEEYSDGKFGFWSADQTSKDAVKSLSDTETVFSDGYGYLSKNDNDNVMLGSTKLESLSVNDTANKPCAIYCLPWSAMHKRFQAFNGHEKKGYANTSFYDNIELSVNSVKYEVYYNPHFAKAIALDQNSAATNPQVALIRTARHLYELGSSNNILWPESVDYWNLNGSWNYFQERDIDCSEYNCATYNGIGTLTQGMIGYNNGDNPFKRTYDGRNKKISNLTIQSNNYALFGYNAGTIENVILEGAKVGQTYSLLPASGLVYDNMASSETKEGNISGKIYNCKLINANITSYNGVSGIAFYNGASITKCSIENSKLSTFGTAAGLVWQNRYSTGTVSGCSLVNTDITATSYASGFVDWNNDGKSISGCSITGGSITGWSIATGAIRRNEGEEVTGCTLTDVNIDAPTGYANGFIDTNQHTVTDCKLIRPQIVGSSWAIGMVDFNWGSITGCYLISPKIYSPGYAFGFAYTSTNKIENCQIYPQQPVSETYLNEYDDAGNVTVNNYTNALIAGNIACGFIYKEGGGTIKNCSVTASVVSGNATISSDNKVSVVTASKYGTAAGFIYTGSGTVSHCYSNCYTVGGIATGFSYTATSGITNCYSLGKVLSPSTYTTLCTGFTAQKNSNISSCYTAASVSRCNSYTMAVGGAIQTVTNNLSITGRFGPTATDKNNYYLEGTSPSITETRDADSISFASLMDTQGELKPDSAAANPFDIKLESYNKYPYAGSEGLTMYGDWPLDSSFSARLAYFEIYADNTIGTYIKYPYGTGYEEWDSLKSDQQIITDGYAVLFNKAYGDADDTNSNFKALINNGHVGSGSTTYISWRENTNKGADYSTNSSNEQNALILPTVYGSGISDEISITDSKTINGEYTLRILPYNAVVAGEQLFTNGYQHLAIVDGDNTADYYYMPQFAKSKILISAPVDSSDTFYIRTLRQLITLGSNYGSKLYDNKGVYKYTYNQEMDIDLSGSGADAYSSSYGSIPIEAKYFSTQTPIGTSAKPFIDTYNGYGKTISNITKPFFGYVSGLAGGRVMNITIVNSKLEGTSDDIGLLAKNVIKSAVIDNCSIGEGTSVTGNGANNVGGMIGFLTSGTVTNSNSAATITINSSPNLASVSAGGLFGKIKTSVADNNAIISSCSATGDVTVESTAINNTDLTAYVPAEGGFAGCIEAEIGGIVKVTSCSSKGNVVTPMTTATVNGKEGVTIAAPVDAGGFVGKELNYQRALLLTNLVTILKNAKVVNRPSKQNNMSCWEWLFPSDASRGVDSSTKGFSTQNDPNKLGDTAYGPLTDCILGYTGFNNYYLDPDTNKTKWGLSMEANKAAPDLYSYYVKPFLDDSSYKAILAQKNINNYADPITAENGYLQTVYKYIKQDNMFNMWSFRTANKNATFATARWSEPFNGNDQTSGNKRYYGCSIDLQKDGTFNLKNIATNTFTLTTASASKAKIYFEAYGTNVTAVDYSYINYNDMIKRNASEVPETCTFSGCSFEKTATKNSAYTTDLSSIGIYTTTP